MDIGRAGLGLGLLLAGMPGSAALGQASVMLDSAVFVEHTRDDIRGTARSLEQARRLGRGDRVVTILTWRRAAGGRFTLVNPLPRHLAYEESAEGDEEVSVDGGRSWGTLGHLRIARRLATAEDVTHVRWHVNAPHAGSGRIAYSGIVR